MTTLPPFLLIDSKRMWRAIPDEDTGETRFIPMDGHKVTLLHTQTCGTTVISASWTQSGPCFTVKGPAQTRTRRGSWNPQDRITKQHVLRFSGTALFQSHVRQRYEAQLAEQILQELGVD